MPAPSPQTIACKGGHPKRMKKPRRIRASARLRATPPLASSPSCAGRQQRPPRPRLALTAAPAAAAPPPLLPAARPPSRTCDRATGDGYAAGWPTGALKARLRMQARPRSPPLARTGRAPARRPRPQGPLEARRAGSLEALGELLAVKVLADEDHPVHALLAGLQAGRGRVGSRGVERWVGQGLRGGRLGFERA